MQQPADMACTLVNAAILNVTRTFALVLDAQIELLRLRLKVAEASLEDVRAMEHALSGPQDWSLFPFGPHVLAKMHSTHAATALAAWGDFTNNLQAACLHQLTEWNEHTLGPQAQLGSPQLFLASADSLRSFFDSFNAEEAADSEANSKTSRRYTDANAKHAA